MMSCVCVCVCVNSGVQGSASACKWYITPTAGSLYPHLFPLSVIPSFVFLLAQKHKSASEML